MTDVLIVTTTDDVLWPDSEAPRPESLRMTRRLTVERSNAPGKVHVDITVRGQDGTIRALAGLDLGLRDALRVLAHLARLTKELIP